MAPTRATPPHLGDTRRNLFRAPSSPPASGPPVRVCYTAPGGERGEGVAALDRFEQFFERIVEGTIMRFFRSPIQPAEIGRKLERAMEDGRLVSVGSTLVPNDYQVEMHPQDM